MSNKREFKKSIDAISTSAATYMMDVSILVDGVNEEEITKAVALILTAAESAILKSNVKFDKSPKAFPEGGYAKARRAFYKQMYANITKEFNEALDKAVKIFNGAIPAEVKQENIKLMQGK
ncbi:MAG: hypothetical protein NC217_02015 [Muribaculaceae bacterium]|nr:hypothetical protein [Muribaculaceae bacterium]